MTAARSGPSIALAEDHAYNHCRQEILSFLYEKQRKVETLAPRKAATFGRKEKVAA